MRFHPTVYHMEWEKMLALSDQFLALQPEQPQLLYLWGHTYELDATGRWEAFERFCARIAGRDDVRGHLAPSHDLDPFAVSSPLEDAECVAADLPGANKCRHRRPGSRSSRPRRVTRPPCGWVAHHPDGAPG